MDLSNKTQTSFWTVKEIAEYTGLSEKTIWRIVGSGKLGSIKLKGSRKIRHSQFVEYLGFDPLTESTLTESIIRRNASQASQSKSDNLPLFPLSEEVRD